MKCQIKYISELGRSFDTAEEAIEDDARLPGIIAVYEDDLRRMEAGDETFAGRPVNDELKALWRQSIADYKACWVTAQASWAKHASIVAIVQRAGEAAVEATKNAARREALLDRLNLTLEEMALLEIKTTPGARHARCQSVSNETQ